MSKLKERIPNEEALQAQITEHLPAITAAIMAAVGPLEQEYIAYNRKILVFTGAVVVYFVSIQLGFLMLTSFFGELAAAGFLFLLLPFFMLRYMYRYVRDHGAVKRAFASGVDAVVYEQVFKMLGYAGTHIKHTSVNTASLSAKYPALSKVLESLASPQESSPESVKVKGELEQSELITRPHNTVTVDNLIATQLANVDLTMSELDVSHETGSGKNRSVQQIFKGNFVVVDLPKKLSGRTFVTSEGDTHGFGHRSFLSDGKDGVHETVLEWGEFEEMLHVATTDEMEARYILTPNFMATLHDWWKGKTGNIRISFINSRLYLLFPDDMVRFSHTISKITEKETEEYCLSIARPLLHVIHLVEEVRL
jgi:Protein of unknown function (DUF3137)